MKLTSDTEWWVALDCHGTRIEEFGGKILGEADQDWGHMLVFTDPDGNVLKLMNPKY